MPQNNVLPDWRATYPNDAPAQKPGGVTVLTTATAPRVPNKPSYSAGTIQSYDVESGQMVMLEVQDQVTEEAAPEVQEEAPSAEAEEGDEGGDDPSSTTVTRTTTRTTTRRR